MTVPTMVEGPVPVGFVVVDREIAVREPDEFEAGRLDSGGVQTVGVGTDDAVRGEVGLFANALETLVVNRGTSWTSSRLSSRQFSSVSASITSTSPDMYRMQDELHQAANRILDESRDHGCTHIAFENLTGFRDRMAGAKRFHAWAFRP